MERIYHGEIKSSKLELYQDDIFQMNIQALEGQKIELILRKAKSKNRTELQNRALHKYFSLLAEELNNAGFDMKKTIKEDVDIAWSGMSVKEYLWRPIQKVYLQEQSTTRLKTGDIDKIYDILNKIIGERTGVFVPFPSIDNILDIDYT